MQLAVNAKEEVLDNSSWSVFIFIEYLLIPELYAKFGSFRMIAALRKTNL